MRIAFMGTPEFAVPTLKALHGADHEICVVYTRPDAVRSRGKQLQPSPVKLEAQALGLTLVETARLSDEHIAALKALELDCICVAAYGCILPDAVLDAARFGCINVHASLLPRWRGAAPIQRAILSGDECAGVSIMKIGQGVDTGDYSLQASVQVQDKTSAELSSELAVLGADILIKALAQLEVGTLVWTKQDETLVTHAAKLSKAEMMLTPHMTADEAYRHVRASGDTAPARCLFAGKALRLLKVGLSDAALAPGAVHIVGKHVYMGFTDAALEVFELKPDGKRAMDAAAWAAGQRVLELNWDALS
ncbi:methionyl-tRNA formyltransferase [Collinsella sp. zg1085]|uniref:methionyl-tRNA formyltransferase n=1 Tax=Collinsella sp. zg1085 TaxID=2844380 RepID=UPI001C0E7868|nr:methionyl-tRNA formyltransferase [Collinsella sp. zg1085]QWT17143.1 methionyl-tRNA formyltransferase [Collinsella sp. zg1085]